MVSLTAKAVISRVSCTSQPVLVKVAVSYDIAPAIDAIATAFNNQNHTADGRCAQVQVAEGASSAQASEIDGQASMRGQTPISAWIPDSSLWVDVARGLPVGAQAVQAAGRSVARSPLMLVTTPAVAAQTRIFDSPPGWSALLPDGFGGPPANLGVAVDLPDPANSSAGLATLIEESRALGYGSAARTAFTRFALGVESTADFDSVSALSTFVQSTLAPFYRKAVTVASEQAVLAYDRAYPRTPLAARYPGGASTTVGAPELDYPYVLTTSGGAQQAAATEFGYYLQTSYANATIRYYGFRSPDGLADAMPSYADLSSQPLQLASAASPAEVASSVQVWKQLGIATRAVALIDVSPAMNQPAGSGTTVTLEQELTQTASRGLALFPDSAELGVWEVGKSSSAASPYTQLVPVGPLTANLGLITRRVQLQQITATLTTGNGKLALNDAILAAYQQMTDTYAASHLNAVLVLTAGDDSAPGDISLNSLLPKLRALYNPSRKIEIIPIMFGQHGNYSALQQIAAATGGVAYMVNNPAVVGKIFFAAIAQRICDQGCVAP